LFEAEGSGLPEEESEKEEEDPEEDPRSEEPSVPAESSPAQDMDPEPSSSLDLGGLSRKVLLFDGRQGWAFHVWWDDLNLRWA